MKIIYTTDGKFLGVEVVINCASKTVSLISGEVISYDKIIERESEIVLVNSNYIIVVNNKQE